MEYVLTSPFILNSFLLMHFKIHFQIPELRKLLSKIMCKRASTSFFSSTQTKKHNLQ